MTTYKAIRGLTIQTVAGDPSPLTTGDIWYSSATRKIRGAALGAGTWATGGNLNTARISAGASGTLPAGLIIGGEPVTGISEEYDGSSWTEAGDLNTARRESGCFGTQTATLSAAGSTGSSVANVESYNGASWTEIADVNTAGYGRGAAQIGTTTAGLIFGGHFPPFDNAEVWNGTAWTEVADLNTARGWAGGAGTSTDAIAIAGYHHPPGALNVAETWDGSSWTEVADLNSARFYGGWAGSSSTDAMLSGGQPATAGITELWNGTAWTEQADMSQNRDYTQGSGATAGTGAWTAGGRLIGTPGGNQDTTDEWTVAAEASSFTSS